MFYGIIWALLPYSYSCCCCFLYCCSFSDGSMVFFSLLRIFSHSSLWDLLHTQRQMYSHNAPSMREFRFSFAWALYISILSGARYKTLLLQTQCCCYWNQRVLRASRFNLWLCLNKFVAFCSCWSSLLRRTRSHWFLYLGLYNSIAADEPNDE